MEGQTMTIEEVKELLPDVPVILLGKRARQTVGQVSGRKEAFATVTVRFIYGGMEDRLSQTYSWEAVTRAANGQPLKW